MSILRVTCIFVFTCVVYGQDVTYKEISIPDGRILGTELITFENNTYYAFQDIPYAQPPIGPLRMQEPIPPEKWEDVLNATGNHKVCHQFRKGSEDPRENEDCLVLNVYTPVDPNTDKANLPVLVWIHGGTFVVWYGARNAWGPDYFIDKEVIVVTINYRLGPLGFLSTQDEVLPGNLGLKDQLLAIKWVNENIAYFGGDPDQVTIGGQSAGAASVGYHILNEKASGLFRGAIMESGSPLNCWALQKNARKIAFELGSNLSPDISSTSSSEELLSILMTADVKKLKEADYKIMPNLQTKNCHLFTSTVWAPVVETGDSETAVVTGMNHERIKNGNINRIPILIGFNSQESLLFGIIGPVLQCDIFDLLLDKSITENLNMEEKNKHTAGSDLRKIYTNSTYRSNQANAINFVSDCMFNTPVARHAFLQSTYTDVFFYQFSHLGVMGRCVFTDAKEADGVAHQEEVGYFWRNSSTWDLNSYPQDDILVHDTVVELWSQFIKYSNPTALTSKILQNVIWPTVTKDSFKYMNLDTILEVKQYPKHYEQYSSIYTEYAEDKLDTY